MGLWADMSEVERVAHSIRHGNKYHLKDSKAGLLDQAAAYNDEVFQGTTQRRGAGGAPQAAPGDPDRPDGVSQYVWDRVMGNTLAGLNTANITHGDGAMRDALLAAGHEDYVKKAYEESMRQRAGHYGMNGADDAWGNAQHEWYTERYGNFFDDSVQNSSPSLGFGHSQPDVSYAPAGSSGGVTGMPSGGASANPDFGQAVEMTNRAGNTPFIDAYMRSREAAKKEGPVTGMMKKYMEE